MTLKEIMFYKTFAVVGDTLKEEKYAYKIKHKLIEAGYKVFEVGKGQSLNDINEDIDIIDLCINPTLGYQILLENHKPVKCVLIQPGAESEEIKKLLQQREIPYVEGCALLGLSLLKN